MLKSLSLLFMILSPIAGLAQDLDTIRIMHYNLLNYRNSTNQCTESTNNSADKDAYLSTITAYVKPDVLTVNEMGAHWLNPNKLLTNALNTNGISHFEQAEYANNGFSSLTNMLFFNTVKLAKYSQHIITKDVNGDELVRVIDLYTLYYKDIDGLANGDTTFISFIVAHLKAGSTGADKTKRALMTEAIMKYLESSKSDHSYFLCGDLNIQTSSETCYKNLVEATDDEIRFYDPIEAPGSWNNNGNYANLHTQSTHVSDTRGGCFSAGGMDDRFDFILCGKEVVKKTKRVGYMEGSYKALGQDSRRFNGDMKSPSNSLIPKEISEALYEMSDHLPVILEAEVAKTNMGTQRFDKFSRLIVKYEPENKVSFEFEMVHVTEMQIVDFRGKTVFRSGDVGSVSKLNITTDQLAAGMYVMIIETRSANLLINKFIVQ